jgi:hypothetical protein
MANEKAEFKTDTIPLLPQQSASASAPQQDQLSGQDAALGVHSG